MSDDLNVSDEAKEKLLQAMRVEAAKKKVLDALKKNGSLDEAIAVRTVKNLMKD